MFSLWDADAPVRWQATRAQSQQVISAVWPELLPYPKYLLQPVDLVWFRRLEFDEKMPWDRVHGTVPACGALGLTWARLEVVITWDEQTRWVRFGAPSYHDGRRYVQVFTDLKRDKDGNLHYTSYDAGVFRLSQKYEDYLTVGAPFLYQKR